MKLLHISSSQINDDASATRTCNALTTLLLSMISLLNGDGEVNDGKIVSGIDGGDDDDDDDVKLLVLAVLTVLIVEPRR
jgi:hypothetical protein